MNTPAIFYRISRPTLLAFVMVCTMLLMSDLLTKRAVGDDDFVAIQRGQTKQLHFDGPRWNSKDDLLIGAGVGNVAWANRGLVGTHGVVRILLSLEALEHTAASITVGESQFGLDGQDGRLFVQGPLFGGTTRHLDSRLRLIEPGIPFDFELTKEGETLRVAINGMEVYRGQSAVKLGRVGLRPWRGKMRVYDFSLSGELTQGTLLGESQSREITIPTISLADDTDRQVVIAGGDDKIYQGHPTTLLMPDGQTMFAAWSYDHGGACGPLKKSSDGGLTWSELISVPENWSQVRNCPALHRLVDRDGIARLFVFAGNGDMYQAVSDDEGNSWSEMRPNGLKCIVAPITILPIENGNRHLALYHRGAGDKDRPPLQIWQAISSDGGLTWDDQRMVAAVDGANPCEPFVLRSPDGEQLICLMRENARRFNSLAMVSNDEGQTWSEPQEVNCSLTGDRHVARYTEDGRLVIVFRDVAKGSASFGQFVAWVGKYDDILEQRAGQYRVQLLIHHGRPLDTGYPGLELLNDGTFVATTYVGYRPGEKNSIVSVRFQVEETDRMAEEIAPKVLWKQGEGDYHTYRIPSLIKTKQGTLLAFCEARKKSASDTGKIDLVMRRSEDGGKSWSDQQVLWEDGDNTCGNPCPVVDEETGAIWLLLTHNLGHDNESAIKAKTAEGTRTVWVCHSVDDGKSWTDPIDITSTTKNVEWGWYATGPGVGIQIKNGPHQGRLVVPCDHSYDVEKSENPAGHEFGAHVIFSDDQGKSWQLGGTIRPKMNECQVVEVGDAGELLIDMRSYRGQGCRAQARSTDGGLTWTDPEDIRQLVAPVCQASIIRLAAPGMGKRPTLLFSSPGDPAKRVNLTLRISHDDGKDWSQSLTLYPGPAAYSCLEVLPDGSVACLAEIGERSPYQTISLFTVPAEKIQPPE